MRHRGIRLIAPTRHSLPTKILFMMIENDIEQVQAQVISTMTNPLEHLKLG